MVPQSSSKSKANQNTADVKTHAHRYGTARIIYMNTGFDQFRGEGKKNTFWVNLIYLHQIWSVTQDDVDRENKLGKMMLQWIKLQGP